MGLITIDSANCTISTILTSLNAIALFGTLYFGNRFLSFAVVALTLFVSDFTFGFHPTIAFVYLSFGLIVLLGALLKKNQGFKRVCFVSFLSSCLFFALTNFGEWMMGSLYVKNLQGLSLCYLAALPFFAYQVLGDFFYCLFLFSISQIYSMMDNPKDIISHR